MQFYTNWSCKPLSNLSHGYAPVIGRSQAGKPTTHIKKVVLIGDYHSILSHVIRIVGYARASSEDQDLSVQMEALTAFGAEKITSTHRTRLQLDACLNYLREGDVLVVTRVDRLSRSLRDPQNLVDVLDQQGIALQATEQPIDTGGASGKAFFDMLGVFAEVIELMRQGLRQAEVAQQLGIGIASVYRILKNDRERVPDQLLPESR